MALTKVQKRIRLKKRVRKHIFGTADRPRLTVYKSNKEIYAQIVDDVKKVTLAAFSTKNKGVKISGTKTEQATEVGKQLAQSAKKAGIESVVFDRNGFLYHGRVKALADGVREGGLIF